MPKYSPAAVMARFCRKDTQARELYDIWSTSAGKTEPWERLPESERAAWKYLREEMFDLVEFEEGE